MQFWSSIANRYGGIARVPLMKGHVAYLVSSPELLYELLVTNRQKYRKNTRYRAAVELFGHGLLLNEGDAWKRQRLMSQPAFKTDYVAAQVPWMAELTSKFLDRWRVCAAEPANSRRQTPTSWTCRRLSPVLRAVGHEPAQVSEKHPLSRRRRAVRPRLVAQRRRCVEAPTPHEPAGIQSRLCCGPGPVDGRAHRQVPRALAPLRRRAANSRRRRRLPGPFANASRLLPHGTRLRTHRRRLLPRGDRRQGRVAAPAAQRRAAPTPPRRRLDGAASPTPSATSTSVSTTTSRPSAAGTSQAPASSSCSSTAAARRATSSTTARCATRS